MTIQPARHERHACCPLQAEKPGIQPVEGNTHDSHVKKVLSSYRKILWGFATRMVFWNKKFNSVADLTHFSLKWWCFRGALK